MDAAEHNVLPLRLALRPVVLAEIELQPASRDIWDSKYRLKTKTGEPLDGEIDDTYQRVARTLAKVETTREARKHWYGRFLEALRRGAIPAGRITSNAGARDHKPATSTINCTVSAVVRDSMDDILKKVHEAASPSRRDAASDTSSPPCGRAGHGSAGRGRRLPGRSRSWTSTIGCASRCLRPAGGAARRWPPST